MLANCEIMVEGVLIEYIENKEKLFTVKMPLEVFLKKINIDHV